MRRVFQFGLFILSVHWTLYVSHTAPMLTAQCARMCLRVQACQCVSVYAVRYAYVFRLHMRLQYSASAVCMLGSRIHASAAYTHAHNLFPL